MFASRVTKMICLPGTARAVGIRKLSGAQLQQAYDAQLMVAVEKVQSHGTARVHEEISAAGGPAAIRAAVDADPFQRADRTTLLRFGVVEVVEVVDALDEPAREFLARQIYNFSKGN